MFDRAFDRGAEVGDVAEQAACPQRRCAPALPLDRTPQSQSRQAGFGGQSFIESQVAKIKKLKQMCLEKVRGARTVRACVSV
jgi:hypothetical protein